jgi:hypothetical protein
MTLLRIERITSIATWLVLICRGVLAGPGCVVENCSRVTDAGNVQLIAGRFTTAFDFRDDPAIFDACVLDRHDQILVPVDLSAAGVVGNNSEYASISLFKFAQNLLERQEVRSVFLFRSVGLSPIHLKDRSPGQFRCRNIWLTLANVAFGYRTTGIDSRELRAARAPKVA